ncbi:MAG: hypothetical protein IKQ50_02385 [Paludibacteraceae bacterium]|nr:hypothetical protein [Paludibacteraceae bacterium]
MGQTRLNPLFENISGALAKPKKKNGHKCGEYVIATHRVAETTNPNCQRVYIKPSDAYTRSTPLSTKEMQAQSRFAAVSAAVKARAKSLEHAASDRQAFLEQRDEAEGKKTMRAYLWKVCGDIYDAQHNG